MADIPEMGAMEFKGDLDWTMEAFMNLIKNCDGALLRGGSIHCDLFTESAVYGNSDLG